MGPRVRSAHFTTFGIRMEAYIAADTHRFMKEGDMHHRQFSSYFPHRNLRVELGSRVTT